MSKVKTCAICAGSMLNNKCTCCGWEDKGVVNKLISIITTWNQSRYKQIY